MNKTLKSKWLKALRSGRYKQGKRRLFGKYKEQNRYCCLGVLCKIQGVSIKTMKEHNKSTGDLPYVLTLSGWPVEDEISNLVDMNDGGKNFKTIADYIERNL